MIRWCAARHRAPGATISAAQGWALAQAWYHDRLDPGWRRRTPSETQAVFQSIGLTGPFWQLS